MDTKKEKFKPHRSPESLLCCSSLFVGLLVSVCCSVCLFFHPPSLPLLSLNGLKRRRPVTPLFSYPPLKQLLIHRSTHSSNRWINRYVQFNNHNHSSVTCFTTRTRDGVRSCLNRKRQSQLYRSSRGGFNLIRIIFQFVFKGNNYSVKR